MLVCILIVLLHNSIFKGIKIKGIKSMSFKDNLDNISKRYQELSDLLQNSGSISQDEITKYSKEFSNLTPISEQVDMYKKAIQEIADLELLISEETDKDIVDVANEELVQSKSDLQEIEHQLQLMLIPKDAADEKNAIIEIRAGTGGDEAALFASDLFEMYKRYSESKGWKFEVMSVSETEIGGYKEASALISGNNVFYRLKFESGTHRVQRIPNTESSVEFIHQLQLLLYYQKQKK